MLTCEMCQSILLDHLYGLLDDTEEATLRDHLAACPACVLELERVRLLADRLARAAREEFRNVTFVVPTDLPPTAVAVPAPTLIPIVRPVARQVPGMPSKRTRTLPAGTTGSVSTGSSPRWLRYAVAASLLLVLGGLGIPSAMHYRDWNRHAEAARIAREDLTARQALVAAAQNDFSGRSQKIQAEIASSARAVEQVRQDADLQRQHALMSLAKVQLRVRLTGPDQPIPGAPNEWKIETINRANVYQEAKVDVVVKTQTDREIYRKALPKSKEPPTFQLPVEAWKNVEPDDSLFLEIVSFDANGATSKLSEKVSLAQPTFLTQLVTDKPMYKPGESVYFRSLTLDRTSMLPPQRELRLQYKLKRPDGSEAATIVGRDRLEKVAASGTVVTIDGPDKKPLRGVGSGAFAIEDGAVGGEYLLEVAELVRDPATHQDKTVVLDSRKVLVNKYQADRLMKKLEFDGRSYGAGDNVQILAEASRDAGPLTGAKSFVSATVDGVVVLKDQPFTTDEKGAIAARFVLPTNILAGNGSVSVRFDDGDISETIVRPIPIVGRLLGVEFFPEGGDIVAGIENRVYFQVRTPSGKPADLTGYLTDGTEKVADVATTTFAREPEFNRGEGSFRFTPKPGKVYSLKLTTPANIVEPLLVKATGAEAIVGGMLETLPRGYALPATKADGVVMTIAEGVSDATVPIHVKLASGKPRSLLVGMYARGMLLAQKSVEVEAGKLADVELNPELAAGGVVRVTVFETTPVEGGHAEVRERAERLIFRRPSKTLQLNVTPDASRYGPGSKVGLTISASTETGTKTAAVVMVGVVNQSIVSMADNKTERQLPAHFLIAGEVRNPEELEYADFLLRNDDRAATSLDLLLGTQGWRRFAEQNLNKMQQANPADANRLMVALGQQSQIPRDLTQQKIAEVNREYAGRLETATDRAVAARLAMNEFRADAKWLEPMRTGQEDLNRAVVAHREATTRLDNFDREAGETRAWVLPVFSLLAVGISVTLLIVGLNRTPSARRGWLVGAMAMFVVCGVSLTGMVQMSEREATDHQFASNRASGRADNPAAIDELGAAIDITETDLGFHMAPGMDPKGGGGFVQREREMLRKPGMMPGMPRPMAMEAHAPQAMPVAPAGPFGDMKLAEEKAKAGGDAKAEGRAGADKADRFDDALAANRQKRDENLAKGAKDVGKLKDLAEAKKQMAAGRMIAPMRGGARPMGGLAPMAPPMDMDRRMGKLRDVIGMADREMQMGVEGDAMSLVPPANLPIREYAHTRAGEEGGIRLDFVDTVLWQPALVIPGEGEAKVEFHLGDDLTRYRVLVAGHTLDGRIGAVASDRFQIEARKPFSLDAKLPQEIALSDTLMVPLVVTNDSPESRSVQWKFGTKNLKAVGNSVELDAAQLAGSVNNRPVGTRRYYAFQAQAVGDARVQLSGTSMPLAPADELVRTVKVAQEGFPVVGSVADMLETSATGRVVLPKDMIRGSLKMNLTVHTSTLSDLQNGLEGLLREPNGCFEQTSTSNYPNTLILDMLQSTGTVNPDLSRRAKDMLERGYTKLVGYECYMGTNEQKGFEWFGGSKPAHEALTAYGLLQFRDMSRVMNKVDPKMLARTQTYLMSRRDGQGGFLRNPQAVDSYGGAPKELTDAYIVWALTESDPDNKEQLDLSKEIASLKKQTADGAMKDDPYFLSMVANVLYNKGERPEADALVRRIAEKNLKAGCATGAKTSITSSGGRDLEIETTALFVLAVLKANSPENEKMLRECVKWIAGQRGGYGGFGSMQSTTRAPKWLIEVAKKNPRLDGDGTVTLTLKGKKIGEKAFKKTDTDGIIIDIADAETLFPQGSDSEIEISITSKKPIPFTLGWSCSALTPVASDKRSIDIAATLNRTKVNEGDVVSVDVSVKNKKAERTGMVTAIVGLPAGLKIPEDQKQLIRLRDEGKISFFEIRGREVVLYWRSMTDGQEANVSIDTIAAYAGEYRGPASRAYLYYNADHKHWIEPLKISIAPLAE